jgi:CHAT domain-containing protein
MKRMDPNDAALKRQVFTRIRALADGQASDLRSTLQLARLAAEVGDVNLAAKAALAGLALAGKQPEVRSVAAAALLARFIHSGAVSDLLDAGEILSIGDGDLAARCNRLLVLHSLGLRYRLAEGAGDCPCLRTLDLKLNPEPRFPLDGHRHSADQLAASELNEVETLLVQGNQAHARVVIRLSSQAWRVWFERDALELWRTAVSEVGRRAVEKRVAPLAMLYTEANANPAPVHLWAQLAAVPPRYERTVKESLTHWRDGMTALSRYEPDRVESELGPARRELASWLPVLLPSIDLALAAARFHLGDDRGMLERSLAVRRSVSREAYPWAWARSLWLEALALQAKADWSESLRCAEDAGRIYTSLGELANSGYQDVVRGVALESQVAEEAASSAYLNAVSRIHKAGDTRLLAGALALFARQQSRAGRPHLAVELQRESTTLDSADATPQLVAEAKAVLAEQLFRAGARAEGNQILQEAKVATRHIESAQPRRRAEAILAQVEASGVRDSDPVAAEMALDRFLSEFAAFGERFFRAEALIDRAEARLLLGKLPGAEEDLAAALGEIASQSERLEDRVQSVVLLDRAREALDLFVDLLLRRPDGSSQALRWIEKLRAEQIGLGFGSRNARLRRRRNLSSAPYGSCITEYWAAPAELLAWTSCDGKAPHLDRIKVSRDELLRELRDFRQTAQRGDLADIRQRSASASTWLVAPIGKSLFRSVSWTVIPDALFPAIPVAWLTMDGRFVFQDRVVKVAPSWSQLSDKPARPATLWKGLGIGDPNPGPEASVARLPFARAEVERILTLFPGSNARVGAEATWTSLLQQRGSFDLLHLATHISSGSRVPLSARLQMTPEATRPDGRVSADEVARERFPSLRLAVVASCSSATAAPARIAGSLDFANAFLSAGADEVLGTLWDIPDRETSAAISEFYESLNAGQNPKQALQRIWLKGLENHADVASLSVRAALQLSSTHP